MCCHVSEYVMATFKGTRLVTTITATLNKNASIRQVAGGNLLVSLTTMSRRRSPPHGAKSTTGGRAAALSVAPPVAKVSAAIYICWLF